MTPQPDLSTWPSKPEAARLFGIGERTLDRMMSRKGYPELRMRPRAGKKPEPVINPEDVQRMLAGRSVTSVMPLEDPGGKAVAVRSLGFPMDQTLQMIDRIAQMGRPATPERLFLTLKEASAYSGLSMALLQRLASKGRLTAIKDNGWKIGKCSLDMLEVSMQAGPEELA